MRIVARRCQAFGWKGFPEWFDYWGLDFNGVGEVEVIDLVAGRRLRPGRPRCHSKKGQKKD
jgi:hypothetical protein